MHYHKGIGVEFMLSTNGINHRESIIALVDNIFGIFKKIGNFHLGYYLFISPEVKNLCFAGDFFASGVANLDIVV